MTTNNIGAWRGSDRPAAGRAALTLEHKCRLRADSVSIGVLADRLRGRCSRVLTATQLQTVPQKSLGPSLRPAVQPVRVSLSRTKSRSASRTLQVLAAAAQKEVASDKPKVVVLGTGLMGSKAAQRLIEEGFIVTAWNRDASKAEALKKAGVESNENLVEAVGEADVALLLLADASAIDSVLLADEAVLKALKGRTVLQMGTIGPDESRNFNKKLGQAGVKYLEAPVQGSHPEVAAGSLVIMVGSDEDPHLSPAWPVLEALGDNPRHMGKVGEAAAIKLAFNQLVASLMVGFATSLGLLERNNADVEKFMELLRESKLYAPTFDKKLPRMLDRDFTNPNFPTKHLLKDIQLFQIEAKSAGLDPSMLAGLEAVIAKTCKEGLDDTDYSAVYSGVNPEQ